MRWIHRVRLYPTGSQVERLHFMLDVTRQTYNALLEERRYAWRARRIAVTSAAQYAEITALRREDARFRAVYRECVDAVLHRLDLAYEAFFRRVKRGETAGFPRYKAASRWRQLTFPHGSRALKFNATQSRVRIPGVGTVGVRKGRPVPAFGRAFVSEKNGRWYALFECTRDPAPLPSTGHIIGVDRGVHVLAATSDGELLANGKYGERLRRVVRGHQRALEAATERDEQGRCINRDDPKRMTLVRRLARAKEREANARLDHAHKAALRLIRSADVIGLEDLNVSQMTRSAKGTVASPGRNVAAKAGLNRAMLDAGFGLLRRLIGEKAAYAARRVIEVDPKFSSQTCRHCRHVSGKSRRRRRFRCVACGWSAHADVAAALEICRRAEIPCSGSRGNGLEGWVELTPRLKHGIRQDQKLSHDGGYHNHPRLSGQGEPICKRLQLWIVAYCCEGRIEEGFSQTRVACSTDRAATSDRGSRLQCPGRESGVRRDRLRTAKTIESRQLGQDQRRGGVADPLDGGQQVVPYFKARMPIDVVSNRTLDFGDFTTQIRDDRFDRRGDLQR